MNLGRICELSVRWICNRRCKQIVFEYESDSKIVFRDGFVNLCVSARFSFCLGLRPALLLSKKQFLPCRGLICFDNISSNKKQYGSTPRACGRQAPGSRPMLKMNSHT